MSAVGFSIIIPVYNAELIIDKTIESLKKLDYQNYEVILVNDGSTDKTEDIIKQSINGYHKFHLVSTTNNGPGPARNIGIANAINEYLLFFDVDDVPKKTILKDYNEIHSKHTDIDLIVSSFTYVTKKNNVVVSSKDYIADERIYRSKNEFLDDLYSLMNKQLMYVVWNKCYKSKIVKENSICFKNYRSCEDRIFNLEYFKKCNKSFISSKIEYVYEFESGKGITNDYSINKYQTFKEFYELTNELTNGRNKSGTASLFLKGVTSVIFSILNNNDLSNAEKKEEISSLLNDSATVEAKKIAITDTKSKWMLKKIYNLPTFLFIKLISSGNFIELKLPRIMSALKKVY
ncbi:glycosyltransferase family A protein [Enterococcus pallens]|uniref:Glycosyltransferase 2-like domain-containing protein n=1 Tax=Enterococcus pallens ATCC BAA-351 TaxID=1158607 RepID=R2PT74_9ENTE|nr:glycosyltransferase family A protein [Enterococcus pallens]EOH87792.1 hypothetical protein UAU_04646 [Enterococcus pallens ATCC BAA-351]EOU18006.1 hypothetical protein I588_02994 [Enterococcus pallens ATCC BAA-351]OJG82370.1 hypothetical protein RV10_GL000191 [Enterococcus pallens]